MNKKETTNDRHNLSWTSTIFRSAAEPTYPEAPNGATLVTIRFRVRDNASGYRIAALQLRAPQEIKHHYWAYNKGTWS